MPRARKYPEKLLARGTRPLFESGRPSAHVARDLGVPSETLHQYVRHVEADESRRKGQLSTALDETAREVWNETRRHVQDLKPLLSTSSCCRPLLSLTDEIAIEHAEYPGGGNEGRQRDADLDNRAANRPSADHGQSHHAHRGRASQESTRVERYGANTPADSHHQQRLVGQPRRRGSRLPPRSCRAAVRRSG
jgi:transposase